MSTVPAVNPPLAYALTYVEILIPPWAQNSPPDSPDLTTTYRFTMDVDYLPSDIEAIASIKSVAYTPTTISLGENLGQRATVTVIFKDHRHVMGGEDFNAGTFWGKFRARYGLRLRGRSLILRRGKLGDALDDMENRYFLIESTDGPNADGDFKIIAKDVLKLVDNDRAQAPVLSNGFLNAGINAAAASLTLSPAGIGSDEYPASGYVAVGGKEIMAFTRSGDVLTITRAQFNTTAQAHDAEDRVQLCLQYSGDDPADILYDLLTGYGGVSPGYINLAEWQAETAAYLGIAFTALIAEPTGVNKLASEVIEQMAGAIWWDDINQRIRLQVLRNISTAARLYSADNYLADSLDVEDQPNKRISVVQVYFGKINPLVKDDQDDNYRSTAQVSDDDAATDYGGTVIKKIRSRWIAGGGRSTAETLANKQLGRYRDPPRRFHFDVQRFIELDPLLGAGYNLQGWPFQDQNGDPDTVPIQVVQIDPAMDRFTVEAEEMLWTPYGGDIDPTNRTITFDANENDINIRTRHDQLYAEAQSGDTINVIVNSGVTIGSTSTATYAMETGSFAGGVTLNITNNGRIQGKGGAGGAGAGGGGTGTNDGGPGLTGGPAFRATFACTFSNASGEVSGGGGGGGGGSINVQGGGGGGGGAGTQGGAGGIAPFAHGGTGSSTAGGAGGSGFGITTGGAGGGLGAAGSTGGTGIGGTPGAGGSPGNAVNGVSFINSGAGVTNGTVNGAQV